MVMREQTEKGAGTGVAPPTCGTTCKKKNGVSPGPQHGVGRCYFFEGRRGALRRRDASNYSRVI